MVSRIERVRSERLEIELLKRMILFGSPAAKAAALTILDEKTGHRLIRRLKEVLNEENGAIHP
ncbi:MAG: hypothetical protein QXU17_00255 [Archaeoglobaceae archaeon]